MRTAIVSGIVVMLLAGCAMMKNTRQQDIVWDAYHECQAEQRVTGNVQMTRVESDGRYWYQWSSSPYGASAFQACITEKVRAAVKAGR